MILTACNSTAFASQFTPSWWQSDWWGYSAFHQLHEAGLLTDAEYGRVRSKSDPGSRPGPEDFAEAIQIAFTRSDASSEEVLIQLDLLYFNFSHLLKVTGVESARRKSSWYALTQLEEYEFFQPEMEIPLDNWAYSALDYLDSKDLRAARYPSGFFNGDWPRMRIEFASAIADLLESTESMGDEDWDKIDAPKEQVRIMIETLRTEFSIQTAQRSTALHVTSPPLDANYYGSTYGDVNPNHWAYKAFAYYADIGLLEGYPDEFFDGRMLLSRYEFAQAAARLLDTMDLMNKPIRESDRALAEALRIEFSDQLSHMGCID